MTVVFLAGGLGARHADLVSIQDDDEIAGVDMGGVLRLVLALENMGGLGSNATQHLVSGVDDEPLARNLLRLCVIRLHCILQ